MTEEKYNAIWTDFGIINLPEPIPHKNGGYYDYCRKALELHCFAGGTPNDFHPLPYSLFYSETWIEYHGEPKDWPVGTGFTRHGDIPHSPAQT